MEEAWQNYWVETADGGAATVTVETNDDNDDGYPDGTVERWSLEFPSLDQALKHAGKSRVGISGVVVSVYLDGEKI